MDWLERRKKAREETLGAPTTYKQIGVKVGDSYYAVREPTINERAEISKAAAEVLEDGKVEFDLGAQQVLAVVACTFLADPVMEADPTQPAGADGTPAMRVKMEELPELDARGDALMRQKLDADGNPVVDEDGAPVKEPKTKSHPMVTSPFTGEAKLYGKGDLKVLLGKPVSSFMAAFIPAAMRLFNPKLEDAHKSNGS